jgi:tetratricopeptide (TPR) repeat protein
LPGSPFCGAGARIDARFERVLGQCRRVDFGRTPLHHAVQVCVFLAGVCAFAPAAAAPYRPADDAEVLERLSAAVRSSRTDLKALHERVARAPADVAAATVLARRYIELGRAELDPRFYGYAEAVLRPWWEQPEPPLDILVLRAVLRQARHEFAPALADLDRVLAAAPNNAQAWLSRAVIQMVRGVPHEAQQSCARLAPLTEALITATCTATATGLQGHDESAYALLNGAVSNARAGGNPAIRQWAIGVLAEIAARRGDRVAAERHFSEALALGPRNAYLLGAYADFLLDAGRPASARVLLKDETAIDSLLLRLALAERALGMSDWSAHAGLLRDRLDAAQRRGDTAHLREQARAALHLFDDPVAALRIAVANWAVQREPPDARIVLEAASASGWPDAARPVLDWIAGTGLADTHISALVDRFRMSSRAAP